MGSADVSTKSQGDSFPVRVPIKVIGREGILDPAAIASIIFDRIGEQDRTGWHSKKKGTFVSHTFWIQIPDLEMEANIRKAVHELPGVVMQL